MKIDKLDIFLNKQRKLFIQNIKWFWREEKELNSIDVHHYGTFATSSYCIPFTDIHYCSRNGLVIPENRGRVLDPLESGNRYYVYMDDGDGEYFKTLTDAENKVIEIKWKERKKDLIDQFKLTK